MIQVLKKLGELKLKMESLNEMAPLTEIERLNLPHLVTYKQLTSKKLRFQKIASA